MNMLPTLRRCVFLEILLRFEVRIPWGHLGCDVEMQNGHQLLHAHRLPPPPAVAVRQQLFPFALVYHSFISKRSTPRRVINFEYRSTTWRCAHAEDQS